MQRCLVARQFDAEIDPDSQDNCVSDGNVVRYPLNRETVGELEGTPINSDEKMNLVTCLISDSYGIYTAAIPVTKLECQLRARRPSTNYTMIVPDYVDIEFVPEDLVIGDDTMVQCRTSIGEIITTRKSCAREHGEELRVRQVVPDPDGWVRCKVSTYEVLTTADVCIKDGGIVLDQDP
jgi:hypothetical protein